MEAAQPGMAVPEKAARQRVRATVSGSGRPRRRIGGLKPPLQLRIIGVNESLLEDVWRTGICGSL